MSQDRLPEIDADKIACQQIIANDHSVFSIQWVFIPGISPGDLSSVNLCERYLQYIRHCTSGIISPVCIPDGVQFRLLNSSLSLLQFLSPRHESGGGVDRTIMNISGGILVDSHECDRGQLEFIVEESAAGCRFTMKLSDYCPLILGSRQPSRWRRLLYRFTQAYIHKIVTVNFLSKIYRDVTGKPLRRGVVKVAVREGRNI